MTIYFNSLVSITQSNKKFQTINSHYNQTPLSYSLSYAGYFTSLNTVKFLACLSEANRSLAKKVNGLNLVENFNNKTVKKQAISHKIHLIANHRLFLIK